MGRWSSWDGRSADCPTIGDWLREYVTRRGFEIRVAAEPVPSEAMTVISTGSMVLMSPPEPEGMFRDSTDSGCFVATIS